MHSHVDMSDYRQCFYALADLTNALKETTDATNTAVTELQGEVADLKTQFAAQQKVVTAMYRPMRQNALA